jgi:hypothetical protein
MDMKLIAKLSWLKRKLRVLESTQGIRHNLTTKLVNVGHGSYLLQG